MTLYAEPFHQTIFEGPVELPVRASWIWAKYPSKPLTYHEECEYHLIKRGRGSYFIANRKYDYQKNTLVIIRSNEVHACLPESGSYLEKASLYLPTLLVKEKKADFFTGEDNFHHVLNLSEQEATTIEIIVNIVCRELETKGEGWDRIIEAVVVHFLLLIRRAMLHMEQRPASSINPLVCRLIEYIESNYNQPLTLYSMAKDAGCTPGHLSRLFKQHTGLGFKQYITQRRIAEAKRLLREDIDLSVDAISQRVGFRDFVVFNRNFKIFTGMTPSAYRRMLA
ncbi:MAG: AraC family transcriptional regulator [bacterium]|jgi:AraC-like DNA-binding protein|nr:AraC family transcriptional regulator [bacterium]MDD4152848.1 AraC family transcriptional regulator [bacterium]